MSSIVDSSTVEGSPRSVPFSKDDGKRKSSRGIVGVVLVELGKLVRDFSGGSVLIFQPQAKRPAIVMLTGYHSTFRPHVLFSLSSL